MEQMVTFDLDPEKNATFYYWTTKLILKLTHFSIE